MKIVVTGGGSGGHITPLLAVSSVLKSQNNELYYIGLGERRERELVGPSGMIMHRIFAGKLRRYHKRRWLEKLADLRTLFLNVLDFFKLLAGFFQSVWLLMSIRPSLVFIKGGYVGLPVGLAAWCLRIPFVIHESDSVPGLTNRVLSRFTSYRLSGFDIPGYVNLGNPIRKEVLLPVKHKPEAFGIVTEAPVVLAIGGSLGSQSLNTAVVQLAKEYNRYEIIHITGDNKATDTNLPHYRQYSFLGSEMFAALQLADVVISRAGANTLSELAALGKASIIVPHPDISANHQYTNAKLMADKQAVILLPQSQLSGESLGREVGGIIEDESLKTSLEQNIKEFAHPDAASDIAEYIQNIEFKSRAGDRG